MRRYDRGIVDCLGMLWREFPEQRLGQLILNITRNPDGSIDQQRLWNMENTELMRLIFDAYMDGRL